MLDKNIENYLNSVGLDGLKSIIEMANVEIFRNYMIRNFNWFIGNFEPHSRRHRCERSWYRFYLDHGRLPKQITFSMLFNNEPSEEYIENLLISKADAYQEQHGLDVLNPEETPELVYKNLTLIGF